MSIMQRVHELLKYSKKSQGAFAREIGTSPQTFSAWVSGRNQPSVAMILRMSKALEVSPTWLLTGEEDADYRGSPDSRKYVKIHQMDLFHKVDERIYDAVVNTAPVKMIQVGHNWVQRFCPSVDESDISLLGVRGNSMEPTLNDGDFVLLDRSVCHVFTDSIYAFISDGDLFIKRLQRVGNKEIRVISDNPRYEAYSVDTEEFRKNYTIIGRVVSVASMRLV